MIDLTNFYGWLLEKDLCSGTAGSREIPVPVVPEHKNRGVLPGPGMTRMPSSERGSVRPEIRHLCMVSSPDRDQGCSPCLPRRSLPAGVSAEPLERRVGVLDQGVEAGLEPGTGDRCVGHGPGRQVVVQRIAAEGRIAHAIEALAGGIIGSRRNQRA